MWKFLKNKYLYWRYSTLDVVDGVAIRQLRSGKWAATVKFYGKTLWIDSNGYGWITSESKVKYAAHDTRYSASLARDMYLDLNT